jgi:hypothetical protein
MAEVAKTGTPSPASLLIPATNKISGLFAGEDLAPGDACYIKASDGKVYRATGAAANAAAVVHGFVPTVAYVAQADAITLIHGSVWRYATALTPGAKLYLSGTVAGGLADAASTGGTTAVGFVVDATRVYLDRTVG